MAGLLLPTVALIIDLVPSCKVSIVRVTPKWQLKRSFFSPLRSNFFLARTVQPHTPKTPTPDRPHIRYNPSQFSSCQHVELRFMLATLMSIPAKLNPERSKADPIDSRTLAKPAVFGCLWVTITVGGSLNKSHNAEQP